MNRMTITESAELLSRSSSSLRLEKFIEQRMDAPCILMQQEDSLDDIALQLEDLTGVVVDQSHLGRVKTLSSDSAVVSSLNEHHSLIAANVGNAHSAGGILLTVRSGSVDLLASLMDSAIESYRLSEENQACREAIEESAMQLAQSFEEQNWLRGFARNATKFTTGSGANEMANGVLQPLGYLLRAEDVFLIVDAEETARSGLCSAKFGDSDFSIQTVESVLHQFELHHESAPLVRNNVQLPTDQGAINSIVAVPVNGGAKSLGFLVGINRSTESLEGLPVYDPEFGSGDVGLLEEAAVLLSTQAHNIHLLVQSNQMFLGSLHAMSGAIDARDPYTQGHSERVARLGFELAQLMKLSEPACQEIYLAGILHDIGKIGIPDAVLLKNGPLTNDEFRTIQKHPEIGYRIIERLGHLQFALPGVLHHHERWDGKGYPHGLDGESIPLMARVLAVADAFDAMTSSRPYRDAMPLSKAVSIISGGAAEQWDAEVVACFQHWIADCQPEQAESQSGAKAFIPQGSPVEQVLQAAMALGL
ncbi:MAG TPA: hypothetical protein DDW52_16040 [Planctomycetaceae bacterium]|nr:hypothetical protein [Planctomycetaceae bacterium]